MCVRNVVKKQQPNEVTYKVQEVGTHNIYIGLVCVLNHVSTMCNNTIEVSLLVSN